jgi:uncharacterized Zn finger protein (UPF0148 family)
MFKEKSSKKRIVTPHNAKDTSTLDAKHQNMINTLSEKRLHLHDMIKERCEIHNQIHFYDNMISNMKTNDLIDTLEYDAIWTSNIQLKERIRSLDRNIQYLSEGRDEIEYYEDTAKVLFEYYDLLENQERNTSTHTISLAPVRATKGRKKLLPVASRSILEALQITPTQPMDDEDACSPSTSPSMPPPVTTQGIDKLSLVDEYLAAVDSNYVRKKNHENLGVCEECQVPLICLQQDGIMVCSQCGYQELLLVEQNRPILRQPSKEASHFSYKRINHFKEWCAQIQGKESTDIPTEIFEKILAEIRKEKITDTKKITYGKMREILKKLKVNKYYEHIIYIINRINGSPTPHFPPELEEKLCNMFKEIQGPFLKYCPPTRKNFLSYSYVLGKFFQILGLDEYLHCCQSLKSREKLHVQDMIFSKICRDLGWPFFPSL